MRREQVFAITAAVVVIGGVSGVTWWTSSAGQPALPTAVDAAEPADPAKGQGDDKPASQSDQPASEKASESGEATTEGLLQALGQPGKSSSKQRLAEATQDIVPVGEPADGNDPAGREASNEATASAGQLQQARASDAPGGAEALSPLVEAIDPYIQPIGPGDDQAIEAMLSDGSAGAGARSSQPALTTVAGGKRINTAMTNVSTDGGGGGAAAGRLASTQGAVASGVPTGGGVSPSNGLPAETGGAGNGQSGSLAMVVPGQMLDPLKVELVNPDAQLSDEAAEAIELIEAGQFDGEGDDATSAPGNGTPAAAPGKPIQSAPTPSAVGGGLVMMSLLLMRRRRQFAGRSAGDR